MGLFTYNHYEEKEQLHLEMKSHKVVLFLKAHMHLYEHVLKGGISLFKTFDHVSRDEWRNFFEEQKLHKDLHGAEGFGYSEVVLSKEKQEYEERMRKEGFRDFKIHPQGQRELYSSIIYLEPYNEYNKRVFGYDMFSEKVCAEAMTKAMQSGEATLSGKIPLLQEFDKDIQPIFLMYLPVYKKSSNPNTPQNKTLEIQGFVYAKFHANDLLKDISEILFSDLDFEIYDGDSSKPKNLLYDSHTNHKSTLYKTTSIKMNGHIWTLQFRTDKVLEGENSYIIFILPSLVLILTLLLYLLLQSLIMAKKNALQAAQKLRISEERLRFALEGIGDGLWDWNLQTNEVFYSKRWKKMLGYEENDINPDVSEWKSRVHPEDIKQTFEDTRAHIEGETDAYVNEHRLKCKDGTYKWILSRGGIVSHDNEGEPLRMVGSHTDIFIRKKMEKELEIYALELETKVTQEVEKNKLHQEKMFNQARHAQMGEMIGMIAHQWRQPLNAVSGAAVNLALRQKFGTLKGEDIDQASTFIQNSAQQMSATIDNFMNFFKSDSEKEHFKVTQVIANIKDMIDAQLLTHNIELEIITDVRLEIYGNKNELTHILLNLILNARDALNTQTKTSKKITIHARIESNGICSLKVTDNGGGIDIKIIDKIFNPYFTTKEQGEGTGIGLHMAKEIIQRSFNGSISVKNTEDGAEFTLYIHTS